MKTEYQHTTKNFNVYFKNNNFYYTYLSHNSLQAFHFNVHGFCHFGQDDWNILLLKHHCCAAN